MPAPKKQFATVDEYIKAFPKDVQSILQKIRQTVRKAAPEAVESISYQIPTFKLDGKYLIYCAAFKTHVGVYPAPRGNDSLMKLLSPYLSGKATVRFALDKPVPYGLVTKIIRFRMKKRQAKKK